MGTRKEDRATSYCPKSPMSETPAVVEEAGGSSRGGADGVRRRR
jgi:hypothetical protein